MKSAVEWFAIELRQCLEKNGKIELTPTLLDKLEEQAKEMERQEKNNIYNESYALGLKHGKQMFRGGFDGEMV